MRPNLSIVQRLTVLFAVLGSFVTNPARAEPPAEPEKESEGAATARKSSGLGLAPGTLSTGNLIIGPNQATAVTQTSDAWEFKFKGYVRAPFRLGFGKGKGDTFADDVDHGMKLHSPPQVPDATYTDWRYTNNLGSPWAELHFAYGNDRASAHVLLGAYNFTDAGYRDLQAQLGINQAFVTLDFPRLFGKYGGVVMNVGAFANAYGAAGRYDAGRYDTYLIGRTHVAGETLTAFFDLSSDFRLTLEHGIGAKLAATPYGFLAEPQPPYLPYPGPVKQGTTLVHHAHLGLTFREKATLTGHYMTTWTDDAQAAGEKDGRISVYGVDLKFLAGIYGDGYFGFSHVESHEVLRLGQGLELLHSYSGWSMRDNYFKGSNTGNGTIDSILFQYTYSLATLLRHPEPFWGQGPDVVLGLYGTMSWVKNNELDEMGVRLLIPKSKVKVGADVTYTMLSWLGASVRFDSVQPDMKDNTQSFAVISPKLIIRTEFVTHEQVVLSYSGYFNKKNVSPAWPNASFPADEHVVAVIGSMWW
jgi:hypothetical protein